MDEVSFLDLYKAAQVLFEKCVLGKSPFIGGQIYNVGKWEFPEKIYGIEV